MALLFFILKISQKISKDEFIVETSFFYHHVIKIKYYCIFFFFIFFYFSLKRIANDMRFYAVLPVKMRLNAEILLGLKLIQNALCV